MIHYLGLLALVGVFLWLAVPRALTQVEATVGNVPTSTAELKQSARHSSGVKHQILVGIEKRLKGLPSGDGLFRPALTVTTKAFEILIGVFFVLACAAYWLFERERTVDLVTSLIPRHKRKTVRDTWDLIDARLGAFVLGLFSPGLWRSGSDSRSHGTSHSPRAFRYLSSLCSRTTSSLPRVLGRAVGLSPLGVLVSVFAVGILFGGFAVLLAIPIAALLATLVDVTVRGKNPADEEVPSVLFPAQDAEGATDSG